MSELGKGSDEKQHRKTKEADEIMIETEVEFIRSRGVVNMFDRFTVRSLAYEYGFNDLVDFIDEDPQGYFNFILRGKRDERA